MSRLPTPINILGIDVTPLTVRQLHEHLESVIQDNDKELILNVNTFTLNLAHKHSWLKSFLNSAEITFCDGVGVVAGARILGENIPERITYADWIWQLGEFSESHGYTLFFLGAKPKIADAAAAQLNMRYPNLKIVGTHHGYFDKTADSFENDMILRKINNAKPNILLVGFGQPLQERWLMENWEKIDANIALPGGAVFDYLSGKLSRAPKWMTDNYLEWLGRLIIEPQRLWRRYLVGNPLFLWRVMKQRVNGNKV